jgi:hypothetical protein
MTDKSSAFRFGNPYNHRLQLEQGAVMKNINATIEDLEEANSF